MKDGGLVLTCRIGESIYLTHQGETIQIMVDSRRGLEVRLRFIGCRSFHILREKLLKTDNREKVNI